MERAPEPMFTEDYVAIWRHLVTAEMCSENSLHISGHSDWKLGAHTIHGLHFGKKAWAIQVSWSIHITITSYWARWRPKSAASWFFTQPFIRTQIKENIKVPRHWPLWGNSPVTSVWPAQKASDAEKKFHLMTSSWSFHEHSSVVPD